MKLNRMPLFAWAMLVTGVMIIFAFTPLIVGTAMLELDRKGFTAFFKPEAGGKPLLWQHIFWVFGHPEVYIMFIPAAGIVSHVVQTLSRRPIVSYTLMVLVDRSHRVHQLRALGPPHVHRRPLGGGARLLYCRQHGNSHPQRSAGVRLDSHDMDRAPGLAHPSSLRTWISGSVHDRWADRR